MTDAHRKRQPGGSQFHLDTTGKAFVAQSEETQVFDVGQFAGSGDVRRYFDDPNGFLREIVRVRLCAFALKRLDPRRHRLTSVQSLRLVIGEAILHDPDRC